MLNITPPSSPHLEEILEESDIQEVIEFDDDDELPPIDEDDNTSETEAMDDVDEGVSVNEEKVDMADLVFSLHKGSVFSCSISPDGTIVASGGEDDLAYMWDSTTGETLFTCTGHKDSVTCCTFNHNGSLLATGDMSGYIQVWKVSSKSKCWEFDVGDLSWMQWHSASNVLLAGTSDGDVWMWLVPAGNTKTFPNYGVPSTCGELSKNGKLLATGYEDGSLRIFDLKSGEVAATFSDGLSHSSTVTSISFNKEGSMFISGSADGSSKLYNISNKKIIHSFNCAIKSGEKEDEEFDYTVEAVAFSPLHANIIVTATLAGYVTVWDITSRTIRHQILQGYGSSAILFHPTLDAFLTTGLDGTIRAYELLTAKPLGRYTGHTDHILDAELDRAGEKLVAASNEGLVRIFKLEDPVR